MEAGRLQGRRRYDYRDVIGRVESGTETESLVWKNGRGRAMPGRLQDVGGRTAPGASSRVIAEDAYMDVGGRTALGASSRAITERPVPFFW